MDVIIKKIIEIEEKAQQVIEDAEIEIDAINEGLNDEIHNIEEKINKMVEKKTHQLLSRSLKDADEKITGIISETEQKLKDMETCVETSSQVWEDQIFHRIVGR